MNEQPNDLLFRGGLAEQDPDVARLIAHEQQRQFAKLIMIASESYAPASVREAEGSVLRNLYAEGYPHRDMHEQSEAEILDYERQMPHFRRLADRRYYKGVELCNVIEALAQRRGAEVFCPPDMQPEQLFLNVQPLSGAVANTAIYHAFLAPGETILTLDLKHGGHLSHGDPVNITGMRQRVVHYKVSEETEKLDYEEIMELAQKERPKMIIGGFTSYPYAPDWDKFRAIADSVGAVLMADIAHTAGLCAAGYYPNPIGKAHVTSFTTHKTMAGPRGAVIITTDEELAAKIDRAVFPGLQGGSHFNKIAATATMFKLAMSDQFKEIQRQTVANANALAQSFVRRGIKVVHGGTDTHMVIVDARTFASFKGEPLMGDIASRLLDVAGIVVNRNTIPGDKSAARPSGLRFGTPWVTQRGLKEAEMDAIADIATDVLKTAKPYALALKTGGSTPRAKVNFDALLDAAARSHALAEQAGADAERKPYTYPFVFDVASGDGRAKKPGSKPTGAQALEIGGDKAGAFLDAVLDDKASTLDAGDRMQATLLAANKQPMCEVSVINTGSSYLVAVADAHATRVAQWLRALSDNLVIFDDNDPGVSVPGPVQVTEWGEMKA